VKLVLFMGDQYALKQFDRLNNEFTVPQTRTILNNVTGLGKLPREASKMIELAQSVLSKRKYSSVHITKLSDGYLEFRIAGGADYHKDYAKIRDTVMRFVAALELACDPAAERQEYLKKLSKIFSKGEEGENNDDFDDRPIVDVLELADQEGTIKNLQKYTAEVKAGKGDKKEISDWFHDKFLRSLFWAFSELNIKQPSSRHRAEVRMIMKRLNIDPASMQNPADPWKEDLLKRLGFRK
jgi:hypothetical protein